MIKTFDKYSSSFDYKNSPMTSDNEGFKGIFARWACRFVKSTNTVSTYGAWLDNNAATVWSNRNSKGLMWFKWALHTNEYSRNAFETTGGVAMMNGIYIYR